MFKERNQFNLFVKEMKGAAAEQILRETVADVSLNGGNTLRGLMDSYMTHLKSGEFNMNMHEFEKGLAEFLVAPFTKNMSIYESTRLAQFDMNAATELIDEFNILQFIREGLGKDRVFDIFQSGIKQAHSWLN